MALPNVQYLPIIAKETADAAFFEILTALSDEYGLIDFCEDSSQGGDYIHIPKFNKSSTSMAVVDAIGASDVTSSQTAATVGHKDQVAVVRHKSMLFEWYSATMQRAGLTDEIFSAEIGRQIGIRAATTIIVDLWKAGIAACTNATADHFHDVWVDTVTAGSQVDVNVSNLNVAKGLMGDLQTQLDVGAMSGKSFNDLTASSISTDYNVVNVMGDVYRDGQFAKVLGTSIIVDDQVPTAAGTTTLSPSKYRTLLLRSRQASSEGLAPFVVSFQRPLQIFEQHVLGAQAVKFQKQAEMSYAIGVRGMTWDVTNGGANPSDADFATSTNWDDAYSDHKEIGIVCLQTN